ncbi:MULTISPECIES: hypothetical protein [unclassified Nocardia]|uniref:hypothetical protein n=1 Tax=unclassified Nocardia TaxID=2637762 RepID=UPI0024A88886|nr:MULTISPECIES: hypothetical protein [unclassified Nocardia]
MTEIIHVGVWRSTEWSTIQIPNGAELTWAKRATLGIPGGSPDPNYFHTYWRVPDWVYGERTALIREGSYPSTDIEGNPIPSLSGIPGAVPFINNDVFFWISTANVVPGDYPPNSSLAPTS